MTLPHANQVHYDSGPNMTPLVDIVMVILIFLMLAGSFAGTTHFLVSNVPIRTDIGRPGGVGVPDEPLDIRVDTSQGAIVARIGGTICRDPETLAQMLQAKQLAYAGNQIPLETVQVQISPARGVPYKQLVQVYQAALNAKFTKVAFASSH